MISVPDPAEGRNPKIFTAAWAMSAPHRLLVRIVV
jgi:hypothetical protein